MKELTQGQLNEISNQKQIATSAIQAIFDIVDSQEAPEIDIHHIAKLGKKAPVAILDITIISEVKL